MLSFLKNFKIFQAMESPVMDAGHPSSSKTNSNKETASLPSLSSLARGQFAIIVGIDSEHPAATRLLELGFLEGSRITLCQQAPFSDDPLVFLVNGLRIALRKTEAAAVFISQEHC